MEPRPDVLGGIAAELAGVDREPEGDAPAQDLALEAEQARVDLRLERR